jgi:hypothetical protein
MAKRLVSKYIGAGKTYLKILDAKMINARSVRVNGSSLSALKNTTVDTVVVQEARNLLLLQTTMIKRKENVKALIIYQANQVCT